MLAGVPFGLGPFELILILAIVVIIFGVGRLPEVGGAVGKGIREFRKASKETEEPEEGPTSSEASIESSAPAEGAPSPQQQARQGHCTNCGAEVPEQAKFCAECGTPVQAGVK